MKMSLFNIIAGLILIIPYVVICTPIHRHSMLDLSQQQQQQQQQQHYQQQQHESQQQHLFSMKNDDFPFGTIPSSSSSLSAEASNTGVSSRVESPQSISSTPLLGGTRLDEDSDRSLLYEQEMGIGQGATNGLRHEQEHGDNFLQENSDELDSVNEEDLNEPHLEEDENVENDLTAATSSMDIIKKLMDDIKNEEEVAIKSVYLMKLLQQPSFGPLPILYVEEPQQSEDSSNINADKRSGRYYRRYPWKRQNGRYRTYEADTRYLCVPSREDVFKLLVGLHENRNGNHQKTVNFCNRKRPAKSIFTNIRFIG